MEIRTDILSRDDYIRAISTIIESLTDSGMHEVLVAFGFGCDCPDEQLYEDVPMPLKGLLSHIDEAERMDHYRVAKDNLHVKDVAGRFEMLLCHEADIHFISDEKMLLDSFMVQWTVSGFGLHRSKPLSDSER
jgi:hypothetical protein